MKRQGFLGGTDDQVTPHPRRQVDNNVGISLTNALDNLTIEVNITGRGAGFRITNMAMGNRGPGLGRRDGIISDLFGG